MILILFDRPRESVSARVSSPGTWKTNSTFSFSRHSTSRSDPFKEPPNFEQLHSKNIDDLYEVLGRSLVSPEYPGAAVVTKQVATRRGRAFVSGSLDKLRTKICVDWHYCDKKNQYVNFQALANAVAPL